MTLNELIEVLTEIRDEFKNGDVPVTLYMGDDIRELQPWDIDRIEEGGRLRNVDINANKLNTMANYLVAYTLRHQTQKDTFLEHYQLFLADEYPDGDAKKAAQENYDRIVSGAIDNDKWYVWHASIAAIVNDTDH